jgi:NAD(P) transhydrogenase subunit alpha
MMKNNIIEIDWTDEVLAKTVLTHAGSMYDKAVAHKGTQPAAKVA